MHFSPVTEKDVALLTEWRNRPHVAEWWGGVATLEEVREEVRDEVRREVLAQSLPQRKESSAAVSYLAYHEGEAIGYIQCYVAVDSGDGWWAGQHDASVRGIDQFLANPAQVGRGLGAEMVRAFTQFLLLDPAVSKIQCDPAPNNTRAIRCYEKAGFSQVGRILTPDGPAILMVLERRAEETG